MELSAALRSVHYSVTSGSHVRSLLEKPGVVPMQCKWSAVSKSNLTVSGKLSYLLKKRNSTIVSAVKTAEAAVTANSSVPAESSTKDPEENNALKRATFPKGIEPLLLEVCDETEVAELKLKIGDFEMHVKRNVGAAKAPLSVVSPTIPPPIPSEPMENAVASTPPPATQPKPSPEKINPFTNLSFGKSSKLAALEASGVSGYVLVSSPAVGSFQRGRTVKGKTLPPTYREGDLISEGQVIGWVDRFGHQLPVESDVSGEVLKLLVGEGDAVGYGDPLIAVLPSFHGIK